MSDDEQTAEQPEEVSLAELKERAELTARCDAHGVRLLVIGQQVAKARAAYAEASVRATPDFAQLRRKNIPNVSPELGQGRAALISLVAGPKRTKIDEDALLLLYAIDSPGDLEDYVVPSAFSDDRVIKLIADHYPEFVERRIKGPTREQLVKEIDKRDGWVPRPGDGVLVKVAEVTRMDATGEFQLRPDPRAQQMITAAIDAGRITEDGEIITPGSEEQ